MPQPQRVSPLERFLRILPVFVFSSTVLSLSAYSFGWYRQVGSDLDKYNLASAQESGGVLGITINKEGTLDPTFGTGGKVTVDTTGAGKEDYATGMVQSDQKIVLAGTSTNAKADVDVGLVRLNAGDGSLDQTFGVAGQVVTDFRGVANEANAVGLQSDGKIVVAGGIKVSTSATQAYDFLLARYQPNGDLDSSFGSSGLVTTHFLTSETASSLAIQADGKIVVGGSITVTNVSNDAASTNAFALARYLPNGSLDTSFGVNSTGRRYDFIGIGGSNPASNSSRMNKLALQPDGKILAIGDTKTIDTVNPRNPDILIVRYTSDGGGFDGSFGSGGKIIVASPSGKADYGRDIAVRPNGKILVLAFYADDEPGVVLFQYNSDGTLDASFGNNGKAKTALFGYSGYAISLALQPNGRIIVAGASNGDFALVRFAANGRVDPSFGDKGLALADFGSKPGTKVNSLAFQSSDGKILAAGFAEEDFGVARFFGLPVKRGKPVKKVPPFPGKKVPPPDPTFPAPPAEEM